MHSFCLLFSHGSFCYVKNPPPGKGIFLPPLTAETPALAPREQLWTGSCTFCQISSLFGGGLEELLHSSSTAAAFAHGEGISLEGAPSFAGCPSENPLSGCNWQVPPANEFYAFFDTG